MDLDPDPAIFIIDLQDANKKLILKKVFLVGRLAKATFIHISLHTYSSNVTTLSKPNLVNTH
jgi:hypothetical protein